MSNREHVWKAIRDRAEADESMRKLLETLEKIEDALDEQDFNASNLRLPYSSADEKTNEIWK